MLYGDKIFETHATIIDISKSHSNNMTAMRNNLRINANLHIKIL
jgi:hypothetical protein